MRRIDLGIVPLWEAVPGMKPVFHPYLVEFGAVGTSPGGKFDLELGVPSFKQAIREIAHERVEVGTARKINGFSRIILEMKQ